MDGEITIRGSFGSSAQWLCWRKTMTDRSAWTRQDLLFFDEERRMDGGAMDISMTIDDAYWDIAGWEVCR